MNYLKKLLLAYFNKTTSFIVWETNKFDYINGLDNHSMYNRKPTRSYKDKWAWSFVVSLKYLNIASILWSMWCKDLFELVINWMKNILQVQLLVMNQASFVRWRSLVPKKGHEISIISLCKKMETLTKQNTLLSCCYK